MRPFLLVAVCQPLVRTWSLSLVFSHGFPTPSRLVTDAPKAKLSTATFTRCIQPPWQHVRQQHGRNPVQGPVGALLWMLLYDLDTTVYTYNSLPTPRPPHFLTPAEFNPGDDHYDTTRVAGYDLPKVMTHTAFTRQLGIEGQDIARVPLLNFLHEQWNSWWLRHLAHGGEVRIVVAKSMPESVFAAGLYSAKSDNDILTWMPSLFTSLHRRAPSTTKPAAMKLLTSKIFDFLISLRPTTTTDPASAATILQPQQQLAVANSQLAQQASSPSPPPTPTSSSKRPADPSQASLLDTVDHA